MATVAVPDPLESRQKNWLGALIAGLVLAYSAVALRCYSRYHSRMKFGIDDWLIIAAAFLILPYFIASIVGDMGKHIMYIDAKTYTICLLVDFVSYAVATVFTKASILCFYCRIFPSKTLKRVAIAVGTFTAVYNMAFILQSCFICIPISFLWAGGQATCINATPPFLVFGSINVATDLTILAIPIRYVARLQMTPAKKLQVCGIFLTGGLVCGFGLARVISISSAQATDLSYNYTWAGIWSYFEATIGILAACLPTMGFYFIHTGVATLSRSLRNASNALCSPSKRSMSNSNSSSSSSGEVVRKVERGIEKTTTTLWTYETSATTSTGEGAAPLDAFGSGAKVTTTCFGGT